MPIGSMFECMAFALLSLVHLIMAALAFSMKTEPEKRNSARDCAWTALIMSMLFGLKSAAAYYPLPQSYSSPFVWGFVVIATAASFRFLWSRRKRKAEQPGE